MIELYYWPTPNGHKITLFLEEAGKMGTLEQILHEAGYTRTKEKLAGPKLVGVQRMSLPLPPPHA